MKVLIAADIFPPESGGPATYAVTIANEFVNQKIDVEIVSLNPNSDRFVVSCPLHHVSWRNKLFRYTQYFGLLLRYGAKADVIYAMGPVNAGLPALMAGKILGKKFVVKVVGDYAWEQGMVKGIVHEGIDDFQKVKYPGKIGLLQTIESWVVRHADVVITPSKYLKKLVVGWGVSENKIEVIYNEVEYFSADPIQHDREKWLVTAGRLMPWKGIDTLIGIMPDLIKEIPNLKLKIVGDGPEMIRLRKIIGDNNVENNVQLAGNLPKKKTLTYIASADVFILNSSYEGLSHVIVEAHNQGVPVLASNVGGNNEIVKGDNLFEYNNTEEIKRKILQFISVRRGESKPHSFAGGPAMMVEKTKKILEEVCVS